MSSVVLQCKPTATSAPCGLCGRPTHAPAGTQLFLAEGPDPVCPECGHLHAAPLAALVRLARAAERVGRIGRHTVFPPLTALLDLARAAENFTQATPPRPRRAG